MGNSRVPTPLYSTRWEFLEHDRHTGSGGGRAGGPSRPTKGTPDPVPLLPPPQPPQLLSALAEYFAEFDPYADIPETPQVPVPEIRLRSAPWDIMSDDASYDSSDHDSERPDEEDEESLQDSIWVNLLAHQRQRPTHYTSTLVQALPATSPLADTDDQWIRSLSRCLHRCMHLGSSRLHQSLI